MSLTSYWGWQRTSLTSHFCVPHPETNHAVTGSRLRWPADSRLLSLSMRTVQPTQGRTRFAAVLSQGRAGSFRYWISWGAAMLSTGLEFSNSDWIRIFTHIIANFDSTIGVLTEIRSGHSTRQSQNIRPFVSAKKADQTAIFCFRDQRKISGDCGGNQRRPGSASEPRCLGFIASATWRSDCRGRGSSLISYKTFVRLFDNDLTNILLYSSKCSVQTTRWRPVQFSTADHFQFSRAAMSLFDRHYFPQGTPSSPPRSY